MTEKQIVAAVHRRLMRDANRRADAEIDRKKKDVLWKDRLREAFASTPTRLSRIRL